MRPYVLIALKIWAAFTGAGLVFVALIYGMSLVVTTNPVRREAGMVVALGFWSLWGLVRVASYLVSVRRGLRLRAKGF